MQKNTSQSGFTLVELAVVLVILGALVMGILAGTDLIRAAELRAVTKELHQYATAAHQFKDKYQAMPGDFSKTVDAFPASSDMCDDTNAPSACAGNSDRYMTLPSSANSLNEPMLFWSHLSAANLIAGRYTGRSGGGGSMHALLGENVPQSNLDNSGWSIGVSEDSGASIWLDTTANYGIYFGVHFLYGGQSSGGENAEPTLSSQELYNIDSKIDDGVANDGSVIAVHHNFSCANAAGDYNLMEKDLACSVRFRRLFR